MKKKYMYVFVNNKTIDKGLVTVSKDNYVDGAPLEDYGDYLLTNKSQKNPFKLWLRQNQPEHENSAAQDYLDYLHDQW